jgi:hypothetical protein
VVRDERCGHLTPELSCERANKSALRSSAQSDDRSPASTIVRPAGAEMRARGATASKGVSKKAVTAARLRACLAVSNGEHDLG